MPWVQSSVSSQRYSSHLPSAPLLDTYLLLGGKPDEHMCRILHCKKCPLHFCWFCLASDLCYPQIPCVVNGNIYEACVNRVVTNV